MGTKLRDQFWTPSELAKQLDRSLSSIYEAIRLKQIPAITIGRLKYIPKNWMEQAAKPEA